MSRFHTTTKLLFLILFLFSLLLAEDAEEQIFSLEDDTYHANELNELLQNLKRDPILINSAKKSELQKLPWLTPSEIQIILDVRLDKPFKSFSDLTDSGLNLITINAILPYISFRDKIKLSALQQTRLEFKKATEHRPSCLKYYQKTLLNLGHFNFGFVSQKDEGERDPLDFYSAFINYTNNGFVKQIILGNYRIALGQGILFAPKLGMSKSAAATSIPLKKYSFLKPYTSSYEIWDLRGAAAILQKGHFQLTSFFSNNDLAANLKNGKITSFNLSGLHLIPPELVKEEIIGINLDMNLSNLNLGITASNFSFGSPFADSTRKQEYSAFSIYGKTFQIFKPLFFELATAADKYAGVGGISWGSKEVRHLFLIRYYQKNFPTWHGKPFSAQSNFSNEIGFYFGSTLSPSKNLKINLYFDVWKYPKSRYFEKLPTSGSEEFLQIEFNKKPHNIRLSLRHKSTDKYSSGEEASMIRPLQRIVTRLDWWQQIGHIRFKTRLENISENLDGKYEQGWLCYEELKFKSKNWRIVLNYTVYQSDVLHYLYENGVDGVMQNKILRGDGSFSYILMEYKFGKRFKLQGKLAGKPDENESLTTFFQIISRL